MTISCYLIGEDSLLIQCANALLEKGHNISAVISPLDDARIWSKNNQILYYPDINSFLKTNIKKVDYIFSIVNSHILSKEVIQLANDCVINYHDSLLPKYAGVNATTWAIINSEAEHGVSWHTVNEKIDEGDILKQVRTKVLDEDTAFTLNLRCYEKAIASFKELLTDIETHSLQPTQQKLQERSYYGRGHKLPNFGFIDWTNFPAKLISALHRSLIFNHYDNNVGSLKIYLEDDYVVPLDIEILPLKDPKYTPGQILSISPNSIEISIIDGILKITQFLSKQGFEETVESIVAQYKLKVGYTFSGLKRRAVSKIDNLYSNILKNEHFWLSLIRKANEHSVFQSDNIDKSRENIQKLPSSVALDKLIDYRTDKKEKFLLAAIVIYLYRLNNYDKFSIILLHKDHQRLTKQYANLFAIFLPFIADWPSNISLDGILRYVGCFLRLLRKNNTYFTDVSSRHPNLQNALLDSGIFINMSGNEIISIPRHAILFFNYIKDKNEMEIYHRLNLDNENSELRELANNIVPHISAVIDKLVDNSHVDIASFCFLTSLEKNKLLHQLNKGEKRALPQENIIALINKQVRLFPHNTAIVIDQVVVSYKELWEMSDKVAHYLRSKKIEANGLIGLYVGRNVEMFAIILGILKVGCAYVPLDIRYPMLKIETISNIADLFWIISSDKFKDKLESHFNKKQTINILSVEKILASSERAEQFPLIDNHSALAYVMFTSGTTGDPKGVMVTQKNVINYCLWFSETTHFALHSSIDFSSSIAFDLSIPCTIAPLLVGGSIVICSEETKINPETYLKYLIKHRISHVELTPGYLEMLLNYPHLISELNDLKVVLLGADILPVRDVVKWSKIRPDHIIVNEYGPTETTVSATSYFIGGNVGDYNASVPIGRPAYNTSCYVLDKYENLCPLGMKGELHIGGAQVTNGYLGKPLLTQDKFISTALDGVQDIIYKTGDLVSWLPNGHLQFFGRNDFQVKIHGYRVELTGIEAILLKIPQINQAVVLPKDGAFKEKYLCAYLVLEDESITVNEIKTFLLSHLPLYMIPREFYITDHIPLKPNEKIDFEGLTRQSNKVLSPAAIDESMDKFESYISQLWANIFHNNQIIPTDDFFDVGGNSFIALQIMSELKNYYKVDISLSDLFEYPTIRLIAQKIQALNHMVKSNVMIKRTTSSIVTLSSSLTGIPLFLIHPVGGSVFWYKQLANYLDGKYTVYGVQDVSINGDDLRFQSLEKMAEHYLNDINQQLKKHNCDDYHIAGASFGATVAFEIAHQILKQHKNISFLGMFDGWSKYPQDLMQMNTHDLLQYSVELTTQKEKEELHYLNSLEKYRQKLLLDYQLRSLDTNIFLFKASELWDVFASSDDPYNGWRPFIKGEIKTYVVSGNHETMFFGDNVYKLASIMNNIE